MNTLLIILLTTTIITSALIYYFIFSKKANERYEKEYKQQDEEYNKWKLDLFKEFSEYQNNINAK